MGGGELGGTKWFLNMYFCIDVEIAVKTTETDQLMPPPSFSMPVVKQNKH